MPFSPPVPPEFRPASPADSPPPIADYELLRLIGRGSYGDVWLARGVTGVFRAVKVVWRDRFPDVRPYEREFEGITRFTAISLREPSQLALLHAGRQDTAGFFYYVMELADDTTRGREIDPARYAPCTLKDFAAARGRRLEVDEAVALGTALARALASLHAAGLVHRDIKPSNVILVGGVPKFADVGLVAPASAQLTFVGTEGFVPPEGPGAPSADVYSLGKLLYELATGLDRHDYPRLPPDLDTRPDQRALLELNEVLVRACEPDARQRFADAAALLDELLLLQAGKSVRRLRRAERRTARALRFAAVLAVIAGLAGAGAWVEHKRAAKAEAERDALVSRRIYSANLASAQTAIERGDLPRARQLLDELRPQPGKEDLRGFEWHVLRHKAKGDPHEIIRDKGPEISRLFFSPNESVLAVEDRSQTVTLYDTATLREILRVPGVWKLAGFSADGKWLVGAGKEVVTMRWATADGRADKIGAKVGLPILGVGNSQVLALDHDGTPRLRTWDFDAGKELPPIDLGMADESPSWEPFIAGLSDDRKTLVRAWSRRTKGQTEFRLTCIQLQPSPSFRHRDVGLARPSAIGVDSQGPWALLGEPHEASESIVWRCGDSGWEPTARRLPRDATKVAAVPFTEGGLSLLVLGRELHWQGRSGTGNEARRAGGHEGKITELAVSPIARRAFSSGADGSLFVWQLNPPVPSTFQAWSSNAGQTRMVFSADGKKLWVPADGTSCVLLEVATLAPMARAADMRYPLTQRHGELIGIGAVTGLVVVAADSGKPARRLMAGKSLRIAAVSGNGRTIAAIDDQSALWSADDSLPNPVKTVAKGVTAMQFDHGGDRLWIANPNARELIGIKWPSGNEFLRQALQARITSFTTLADETHLALTLENGTIEIRDSKTGTLVRSAYSGSSSPQSVIISHRNHRVFVAGLEGEIHCFESGTWQHIHALNVGVFSKLHELGTSDNGGAVGALEKNGTLHILRTK